jgi:xanthine dehydrogenase accessory factor
MARVTTPIGLPELTGKDPATIAVSVAAALLQAFEGDRAARVTPSARASMREARP